MTSQPISAERWDMVWAEDLHVLARLRDNGDRPEVPREIDVSFRGDIANLERLAASCASFGFSVQRLEEDDEGEPWLFLVRTQTADDDAICELTKAYLQIEDTFGVECDGWGCVSQTS